MNIEKEILPHSVVLRYEEYKRLHDRLIEAHENERDLLYLVGEALRELENFPCYEKADQIERMAEDIKARINA